MDTEMDERIDQPAAVAGDPGPELGTGPGAVVRPKA